MICKQPYGLTMIQKRLTYDFGWKKRIDGFTLFYLWKNISTGEKRHTRVYFRNWCRVSLRATQDDRKPLLTENVNWKGGKVCAKV